MRLDIRIPIGAMFAILGAILTLFGLFGDKQVYQKSLGFNINLWWGIVMLVFGGLMFWLGRRRDSAIKRAGNGASTPSKLAGGSKKRGH